ncbi:MAG: RnfABCDGE type electron transport complex subunit D [Bacteroidales bacterium]|nr:RnfABCDGE type electron transport complex subunit D [Bacteroidales bacterium]
MNLLNISGSPHVHSDESTKKIMWRVNLALVPMLLCGIAYFGLNALLISLVSVAVCCLSQWLIEKFILKVPSTVCDGSAIVTGLLLAFNVPATAEMIWIVAIGAIFAIAVAKMTFGGLGKNPFNPALAGRVFLLISFPVQMTTWPTVGKWFPMSIDTTTGATPLSIIKEGGNVPMPELMDMFLGHIGGSLGEVSALAILIGAIYLLWRKVITWHIPVTFIGSAFILSGILWLCNPEQFMNPVATILVGGIMLGACFMATDMVTSPMTKMGQIIFGCGCGILTVLIRTWGSYPEGVSFAILLMNAATPLINKWCKPTRFAC